MEEPLVVSPKPDSRRRRRFSLPCCLLFLGYPLGCLRGRSPLARCANAAVQLTVVLLHGMQVTLGAQQYAASERSRDRIVTAKTSEAVAVASIVVTCAYSLVPGLLAQRVFVMEESDLRSRRRIHIPSMLALLHTGADGQAPRCWDDAVSNIFLSTVVVATATLVTLDFMVYNRPDDTVLAYLGAVATAFVDAYTNVSHAVMGWLVLGVAQALRSHLLRHLRPYVLAHRHERRAACHAVLCYLPLVGRASDALQPWLTAHFVLGAARLMLLLAENTDFSRTDALFRATIWLYWALTVSLFLLPFLACYAITHAWSQFVAAMQRAAADELYGLVNPPATPSSAAVASAASAAASAEFAASANPISAATAMAAADGCCSAASADAGAAHSCPHPQPSQPPGSLVTTAAIAASSQRTTAAASSSMAARSASTLPTPSHTATVAPPEAPTAAAIAAGGAESMSTSSDDLSPHTTFAAGLVLSPRASRRAPHGGLGQPHPHARREPSSWWSASSSDDAAEWGVGGGGGGGATVAAVNTAAEPASTHDSDSGGAPQPAQPQPPAPHGARTGGDGSGCCDVDVVRRESVLPLLVAIFQHEPRAYMRVAGWPLSTTTVTVGTLGSTVLTLLNHFIHA